MSPLLFLITIDGLSKKLTNARDRGQITGCRIGNRVSLSHLVFAEALFTIGKSYPSEWRVIFNIITDFGTASGLLVNWSKSLFISSDPEATEIMEIASIFGVKSSQMDEAVTYLGFFLKPNGYKIKDWDWLEKIRKRLYMWCHWWISLGAYYSGKICSA